MHTGESEQKVTALILTGGQGKRIPEAPAPKQFIQIAGKELFLHTLELYQSIAEVDSICLVINEQYKELYENALRRNPIPKLTTFVPGGTRRHISIYNGIMAVKHNGYVIIHNGVNPTTHADVIRRCISLAFSMGASTAYHASFTTTFLKEDGKLGTVLRRDALFYSLDPQVYALEKICKALAPARDDLSRDIPTLELMRHQGYEIGLVESDRDNIKVTLERDIATVEYILKRIRKPV